MRHLCRTPQLHDVTRAVVPADRTATFQWHASMAADAQLRLDNTVRIAECCLDVAIGLPQHQGFRTDTRSELRRWARRFELWRQFGKLNCDQLRCIFRDCS